MTFPEAVQSFCQEFPIYRYDVWAFDRFYLWTNGSQQQRLPFGVVCDWFAERGFPLLRYYQDTHAVGVVILEVRRDLDVTQSR